MQSVTPEDFTVFHQSRATNNKVETFHAKLNQIMQDSDNDIARIENGLNTTKDRKSEVQRNVERRNTAKERLTSGELSPYDFRNAICHTFKQHSFCQ